MTDHTDIRPTWVDIDTAAYARNIEAVRRLLPAGCGVIAVLKADAYGHGAVQLAKQCTPDRVSMIATALIEEALELRRSNITLPLLVLGPLSERQIADAIANELTPGIVGPEELEAVAHVGREIAIHLKLDTGMGRMGTVPGELPRVIEILKSAPFIRVDAFYTHFADSGGNNDEHTQMQIDTFRNMLRELAAAGIRAPKHHLANSAATLRGIGIADDVRIGLALLGAEPLESGGSKLEPVMRWRTEIA
ncbi:MAG TPA: alanine racemase, partial [Thermoanaerobaculia bacterium]|nr:alanine racemase [Thermoanaerobaculia bacterium]